MESNRLYISDISQTTTDEALHDHFSTYGEIDIEVIKNRFTGLNRGFAFVTLSDSSECARALQEEHVILGTKVKVDIARPKVNYPTSQVDSQISDVINPKRIFVGGLLRTLKPEEFKHYFTRFGEIIHDTIMRDQYGRSRGFGYITFDSKQGVDKVLSEKQHKIRGKLVDVKRAQYHKNFGAQRNLVYNNLLSCVGCQRCGNGFVPGYTGGMWALNSFDYNGYYHDAAGSLSSFSCHYNNSYLGSPYWISPVCGASFNKSNVPKVVISSPVRITPKLDEIDEVKGTDSVGDLSKDVVALVVNDGDKRPSNLSGDGDVNSHLKENGLEVKNDGCENIEPTSGVHEVGVDGENGTCNN